MQRVFFSLLIALFFAVPNGRSASWKQRITGGDLDTARRWSVAGTDLGIPYVLENLSIGYLFGDTFSSAWPEEGRGWRSPVMLRSNSHPGGSDGIVWQNAAKVAGDGFAPQIMHNGLKGNDHEGRWEFTVIPNDGISFPETGRQLVSYMSIETWYDNHNGPGNSAWKSRYAGLAYSDNGNDFFRTNLKWENNGDNSDPYQMWTMQRDGEWVYIFSIRAGRQYGPMMLRRVHWNRMFWPAEYQCWGAIGNNWAWGNPCTPILNGRFGEPSVRKLSDGTWVMAYLNLDRGAIVTRTSTGPDRVWSAEKIQVTSWQESSLYGGFIHPWSTSKQNDLYLMVSTWKRDIFNPSKTTAYHVSQYVGTV